MLAEVFHRLSNRGSRRTEAEIQADVRMLLLAPQLELDDDDLRVVNLEAQVGDGRRIDVELGTAAIEIKRNVSTNRAKAEAIEQLRGYVETRTTDTGTRYVGIVTDGVLWSCHHLTGDDFIEVASFDTGEPENGLDNLLVWLEGVLATAQSIPATTEEIRARLGSGSSAHSLDSATIAALYDRHKDLPTVRMKRSLWSKLLVLTLGNQFEDTDELFVEHTLLVNSAEVIAHCVLGLQTTDLDPQDVLSGAIFTSRSIFGVVEQDFFDWPLEVDGGREYVSALIRRLSRFNWAAVEQDVLKTLYESVIGPETRKRLGEYYTPDWLAELVVNEAIDDPLNRRVLDPSCGSGTFLFHSVRRYLAAAREADLSVAEMISGVSRAVIGMDLHPVAVTLARVTYLLAIGQDLLRHPERGAVYIPIYLGDSVQWGGIQNSLWNAGDMVVAVEDHAELFSTELRFPDGLLADALAFDRLVEEMAQLASSRPSGSQAPNLSPLFQRHAVPTAARDTVAATFRTMCSLHDEGRNHIWSYYIRNLARPLWMARRENRVDRLVGNPPWLAFRHMPSDMQARFRQMEEERGLWAGAENATHQDLSALFVVRAVELYLSDQGTFAFVMPNAVVDREHYAGFRRGHYVAGDSRTLIAFDHSWDLRRIRPHFFPRGSSVIFGSRDPNEAQAMPTAVVNFAGNIRNAGTSLSTIGQRLTQEQSNVTVRAGGSSPYASRFRQGAIFSPRVLFFVDRQDAGPLGIAAGSVPVQSSRSATEKKPWRDVPDMGGVVEERFVNPIYSGETLLPYRLTNPLLGIVPFDGQHLMETSEEMGRFPGLAAWWRTANQIWEDNRKSDALTLSQQLDYMRKLSAQLPQPRLRVVYNTSGMHLAAAILSDVQGLVNNKLYWCAVTSEEEARYLLAVLNSPVTTEFVRPLMSYGKDERDIHKHVWKLPIPEYDAQIPTLSRLAELGEEAERIATLLPLREEVHFSAQRRDIRNELSSTQITEEIDQLVFELLS